MKQLLTNLLLVIFFTGFVFATPARFESKMSIPAINKPCIYPTEQILPQEPAAGDIVPLDIVSFHFN